MLDNDFWKGRSVLLTGHTGFKGSWLSLWLHLLGAKVHGYSLDATSKPNMYEVADVTTCLASDTKADIRNLSKLKSIYKETQPEVVFHLAAQALVRESYSDPLETFSTNVMGTANVLEAARSCASVKSVVIVTTDKVYENRETGQAYQENDPLGGHDPYSASKAAAEIITASYRKSYFSSLGQVQVASARAGNVIGGGDWSADRLVPDCLQAFANNEVVILRKPQAIRPWQHVLEPLSGYLLMAEKLFDSENEKYAKAWNFSPNEESHVNVGEVANLLAENWGGNAKIAYIEADKSLHEANLLSLNSTLSQIEMGWKPKWSLEDALKATVSWNKDWLAGENMQQKSLNQIDEFIR